MRQTLREYQSEGLARILEAFREGARFVLMVLATGGGKTSVFCSLAEDLAASGLPVLILVHRRELATQAATRLREFGVDFGFIMSGEPVRPYARVQIASVQSLVKRIQRADPFVMRFLASVRLGICDEAHLSTAATWQTVLELLPNARVLGATATPWRLSGKPLAGSYDACVVVSTPRQLREQGFLCPYVGFSYKTPDLSKVKTTGGEYNERESAAAMSQGLIVDNVVEEWLAHASHLSTVVFNVTVEHSLAVTQRFKDAGVTAEHLDGKTPKEERKAILRRVEEGRTMVLCNVGVAVEGLDIPRLKCCVLNRPTKSKSRAIQCMGRVRRPWNGVVARIHDHAFVIQHHGLPDAERDYSLNAKPESPPSLSRCEKCGAYFETEACTQCNHVNSTKTREEQGLKTVDDAEKIEFESGNEGAAPDDQPKQPEGPVTVRWSENNEGRAYCGVLAKRWEERGDHGQRRMYLLKGVRRDYVLPGTSVLDRKMSFVPLESQVWVTHLGATNLGGSRKRREFKVEVDDGQA